jgi:hypothetical protein
LYLTYRIYLSPNVLVCRHGQPIFVFAPRSRMIIRHLKPGQPAMPPCHLSFSGRNGFDEVCAEHYHLLREFALDHEDANLILQAID